MKIPVCLIIALSSFVFACSDAGAAREEEAFDALTQAARTNSGFLEARSYLSDPEEIDAWYALLIRLRTDFDALCGDTFCEGEFSNYESLGFRCSVRAKSGRIGRCVWTFAASNDEVELTTGKIRVDARTWVCPMPVVPGTPITELIHALSLATEQPMQAVLPRASTSLYDGLIQCL